MAKSQASSARKKTSADTAEAVDQYMAGLKHPHKRAVDALREIICSADSSIAEGVKWNAPSFRTTEYFATTNLRVKDGIGVILHLGAKVRANASVTIKGHEGMLTWPARDRATVSFSGVEDVKARKKAFQDIVLQWIKFV